MRRKLLSELGRKCCPRPRSPLAITALTTLFVASTPSLAEARPLNTVSKVKVLERGDNTVIRLQGSTRPMFSVFKLERPPRLTLDLANCRIARVSNLIDVDSWAVSQIATSQFRTAATAITRVMINFRRPAHYTVKTVGRDVVITVMPHKRRPPAAGKAGEYARAKKDAEAARREAAAQKRLAAGAMQAAKRARDEARQAKASASKLALEAAAARAEARKQQVALGDQARALREARRLLQRNGRAAAQAKVFAERLRQRLMASRRLGDRRDAMVSKLQRELIAAKRGVKSRRSLRRIEAALRLAQARAKAARDDQQGVKRRLAGALARIDAAERARQRAEQRQVAAVNAKRGLESALRQAQIARRDAERARRAAVLARQRADRARLQAEARGKKESARRLAAERARAKSEARAAALAKAIAEVKARKDRLTNAARSIKKLQRALRLAVGREAQQRDRLAKTKQEIDRIRQRARRAKRDKLALALQARRARARQVQLSTTLEQMRARLSRLTSAERSGKRVNRHAKTRLMDAMRRTRAQRDALNRQERRAVASLTMARRRLEAAQAGIRAASHRLETTRKQLARLSSERRREELRRADAQRARRDEESRLKRAEVQRRRAERARRVAAFDLERTKSALSQARKQRQAALVALKQTQAALASAKVARLTESRRGHRARRASPTRSWKRRARRLALSRQRLARFSSRFKGKKRRQLRAKSAIRDIKFVDGRRAARVDIRIDGDVRHELINRDNGLLLKLSGAKLPRLLQRTLDTTAFNGPVKSITSFVADEKTNTVLVKLALRGDAQGSLKRRGDRLILEFPKAVASRAPKARRHRTKVIKDASSYRSRSVTVAGVRARRSSRFRRRRYTGRRIDLDFKDADIHNILRLLSDVGNVNIITSDVVRGQVTIRMKSVPWDQALDVILRAKGLGMVREGNLLRVAPLADLEKEREAELARQKQVLLLQPLETRLIPLSYAQASKILAKLRYTMSPRGKLTYDGRTNMVIARDVAGNLNLLERMIRNLDTQTPQVLIEARIVEARSNYSKQLGIQWGGNFVASGATGNSTGLVFPNQIGIGGGTDDTQAPTGGILLGQDANPNFVVNMPASTGLNSGSALGLTFGSINGAFNLNLRLSAAESHGDVKIVSAPRITTLDNVEAKISQGVTIPFSQVSANGVQTTFKNARLDLTVTPHVTADGSVIMKINVSRNEPDFANTGPRGDPTILTKEASTEMLVKDGDTSVIGGIYTTRDGRSWVKVPWLAEIPILGWFFKQRKDTSDREEVLVFITPRIINRAQSIGR